MSTASPPAKFPFRAVAVDGGVLIELLERGHQFSLYQGILAEDVVPSATILGITEAQYILSRKLGGTKAEQKVQGLLDSNYLDVWPLDSLRLSAGRLKCKRAISLPDCFTLALGIEKSIPALFATREEELDREMVKDPFQIQVHFLDEFP